MKISRSYTPFITVLLLIAALSGYTQTKRTLVDPCEGCEAVFEYGNKKLQSIDTLPDFQKGKTPLKISGIVYLPDGKTPAPGVILYVYQTDQTGVYPTRGDEKGWARRHGFLREWIKTDSRGRYTFYTFRPATYPSRSEPAHIHLTVLEPSGKYYWLDSYLFDDDPLVGSKERNKSPRGGYSGILRLTKENGIFTGKRDIILGKNIPGYR